MCDKARDKGETAERANKKRATTSPVEQKTGKKKKEEVPSITTWTKIAKKQRKLKKKIAETFVQIPGER